MVRNESSVPSYLERYLCVLCTVQIVMRQYYLRDFSSCVCYVVLSLVSTVLGSEL
jgi:hypothetical protein